MSYGLIVGGNNNIQIDTDHQNPGLYEHDTATTWESVDLYDMYADRYRNRHDLNTQHTIIATAIRPPVGIVVAVRPGEIYQSHPDSAPLSQENIEYALYSHAVNSIEPLPQYGMALFDSSGNLVFNSNNRYLKIQEIIDVDTSPLTQSDSLFVSMTIMHNTVNPFYIIPNCLRFRGYGTTERYMYCSVQIIGVSRLSSTSAKLAWLICDTATFPREFSGMAYRVPNPFRVALCTL